MKTIYARLGDLQLGDTLEDGTTVGQIGDALGKVGINIQTANGDLRNMGDVIEELMGKWDQLTTAEQQALAVKLAGKYQYNNLIALLDNAEMYNEQLEASENSLGTINQQQQIYMDSLEGKLNSMQGAFEGLLGSIFNVDDIKPAIDDITELIKLLTSFTSSIGSSSIFAGIIGTGTRVFSKNIADSVGNLVKNRQDRRRKDDDAVSGKNMLRDIGEDPSKYHEKSATFQAAKSLGSRTDIMNEGQLKRAQSLLKQMAAQENEILAKRQQSQAIINKINAAYKMVDATAEEVKLTEDGQIENLEKAMATIENMKTAFDGVNSSSKELQMSFEKVLPGLDQALGTLTQAETLTGQKKGGKRKQGNNQAASALGIINTADIFNTASNTGQKYQQMFGSLESFQALKTAYVEAGQQIDIYNQKGKKSEEQMIQYRQALEDVRNRLIAFIQELREMGDISPELIQSLEKLGIETKQLGMAAEQTGTAVRDMTKELDLKNVTMSIASIAGGLAQIYSVLSSIKSLGGIIADDSLDGGEKLGQIIENLVFTLPMGLFSISSITTEIGNLKGPLGKISGTFRTAAQAASVAGTAANGFKTALKGITAVVKANPAMFAVTAGVTALSAIFAKMGFDEQQNENAEEARQKVLDDYDELEDKAEKVQDAQSKVQEQYDIYKQTGILTDDLTDAVQDYADSLDIPLSKQDLWNEKIKQTIDDLNHAAFVQEQGLAQNAIDAAETAETNLRNSQSQKNKENTPSEGTEKIYSEKAKQVRGYLNNGDNEAGRAGFEEYLTGLGLSIERDSDVIQGLASLQEDLNSGKTLNDGLSGGQAEVLISIVGKDTLPTLVDPATWEPDEAKTIRYYTEKGAKQNNSEIDNVDDLNFSKNKGGEYEVTLADGGNIGEAINQAKAIVGAGANVLRSLAGVSENSTESAKSAYWNYGEITSSAQSFLDSDEVQAYIEAQRSSAYHQILATILQMQDEGEEIDSDKILQVIVDYMKDNPDLVNLLGSSIIGNFASDISANRNIELTDEDKDKITIAQEEVGKDSSAYADEVARQTYDTSKERLTKDRYTQVQTPWGLMADSVSRPAVTTEEELNSFFELVGATTQEAQQKWMDWLNSLDDLDTAGFNNIVDFYQYLIDHGVDPALAEFVVQGVEKAATFADDAAVEKLETSTVNKQEENDAREKSVQQYKTINKFSTKTDDELSEEASQAFADEEAYLQSLVDRELITEAQKHEYLMRMYDEGAQKLIDGTSQLNDDIQKAAMGMQSLSNVSEDTEEAFEGAYDKIYQDVLAHAGIDASPTSVGIAAKAYGQDAVNTLGNKGAALLYQGVSSGVFDSAIDTMSYIRDALEANVPIDMIIEWLKEAVQEGVHVDINAKYDGEFDDQVRQREITETNNIRNAEKWQSFMDSRSGEYSKEYGDNSSYMALQDITQLESFLDEHDLTVDDFNAMGINTVGKTLEEIEQEVLDIKTGQKDKDAAEEKKYKQETATLKQGQYKNQESKYGKGHIDEDELNDSIKSIYDDLKSKGYTLQDLYDSGVDLTQDESKVLSDFYEKMADSANAAEEVTQSFNELSGNISDYTGLSDALDSKSAIQGLMDKADSVYTKEGRSYFTDEEAQDLLKSNPEYVKYLHQVEDGWALNNRAVLEYEQSVLDAGKAMEELTGETADLSAQNESIVTMMSYGSEYSSEDKSGYLDQLLDLNNALMDGSIDPSSFLDQASSQFSEFFASVSAQAINAGQTLSEFFDVNEDAANMTQVFADELYSGIKKLNTQYQAGQITVGQYAKSLSTTASKSIQLKAAQSGLTKTEEGWVKVTKSGTVSLEDMDSESKKSVKQLENMEDSFNRLNAAAEFSDYITDNFEEMTRIFSDSGEVLASAINETDGLQETYRSTIHGLAEEMVNFYQTDELALKATAQQIAETGDKTLEEATEMLQSVDLLSNGMMESSAVAGAAMQGTMTQTQSAINSIATGISLIIQGIMSEIGSIDGEVTGQAQEDSSLDQKITMTQDGKETEVGAIHVPGFKIKLSGKGSSNGAAASTSQGKVQNAGKYNFDSIMSVEEARNKGVNLAADVGNDYVAVYTDGNGHYVGTKATDYQRGAGYLASGVGGLFDGATLSDYDPNKGTSGYTPKNTDTGSGGNGGNGSGSGDDLDQKELLDDELDRYEKVNAQLNKMSNLLDQITAEQARLVGFNQLDYSQKEVENLQRQIELQEEKLELEKQERQEKQAKLAASYGVTFDDEGYINNYKERFNAYLTEINALIAQYNAASSKEDQDAINERIEAKQKEFDDYKDLVDKYDELNSDTIEQTKKDIQDLHDKIEDLMLDIFNKAVDAADAIKDVEDKWADFLKATDARDQDDPILNMEIASKKLANFFDDSSDSVNKYYDTAIARYEELKKKTTDPAQQAAIQKLIDNAKAGKAAQGKGTVEEGGSGYLDMLLSNGKLLTDNIKQYNETGKSDLFGENQAGMMEAAQTVYDQIADAIIDLRSAIDDLQDAIIDSIDYMADKIEEMDDQYDNISKKLDHTSTMLTYAYGDNAYDKQIQVYQTQLALQKSQLTNSIASRDKLKEVVSGLKEGSKERKEAEEKLQEQEEKIYEQTENIAETASQLLNAQANNSVNKWINSWFKFGEDKDQAAMGTDLDWYATQWELINRNADYYLDDVNKAYNIQKLQSQYVDLLDNTSALSTQKKITEQMNQQLGYLRDKTKLSEYDVSYAQAQLEILKQQIALEEAQANKSQMKLRRDSQGNYNYVYTANQDDVKSAQDGLLDAQNNAYNLSKDNLRQSQEDSLSAIQQVKQTLIDIWTDASLTVEQKQARMNFIISNFQEYIQSTGEQISTSEANIINDFYGMVESLTEANAGGLTEIYDTMKAGSLDAFNEIDGHWGNIMSNVTSYIADMNDFGEDLVDTMTKTVEDYNSVIEDAAEKSGVNLKNVESNFEDINAAVGTLEESCKSLQNTLQTVTDSILSMGNSLTKYQNQILSLTNENSELTKIINELRAELNKTNHETAAGATESAATGGVNGGKGNGSSGKGNGSGTGNGGSGDGVPKVGDLATLVWGDYYYDSWGETPNDNVNLGIENGVKIDWRSSTKYGGVSDQTGDFDVHIQGSGLNGSIPYDDLGWVKLSQLKGYDTGGYTGDWNDGSGKLALLHSKEIVLNAADTENILKAVESVRAMTSAMKGVSLAEAVGSIGNLGRSIESSIGTVDQNVNITAEFPNATSADEIKEAILGLNNQVLHYAHRRV